MNVFNRSASARASGEGAQRQSFSRSLSNRFFNRGGSGERTPQEAEKQASSSSSSSGSGSGNQMYLATLMLQQPMSAMEQPYENIKDVHTYKKVRARIVDLISSERALTKADFDMVYVELRRTQDFARQVSLPEKGKLLYKRSESETEPIEQAYGKLKAVGLVHEGDDDNLIKLMIWRQHLRMQEGFEAPSFSDIRQWIGMLYSRTLEMMVVETSRFKNSKPRTRSELFLRLYILGKIAGVDLEFFHTDFRVY